MRGHCIRCGMWSDRLDRCRWCPLCQYELAYGKPLVVGWSAKSQSLTFSVKRLDILLSIGYNEGVGIE